MLRSGAPKASKLWICGGNSYRRTIGGVTSLAADNSPIREHLMFRRGADDVAIRLSRAERARACGNRAKVPHVGQKELSISTRNGPKKVTPFLTP